MERLGGRPTLASMRGWVHMGGRGARPPPHMGAMVKVGLEATAHDMGGWGTSAAIADSGKQPGWGPMLWRGGEQKSTC